MSSAAESRPSGPGQPAGAAKAGSPGLSWTELGDAVWLAAVTRAAHPRSDDPDDDTEPARRPRPDVPPHTPARPTPESGRDFRGGGLSLPGSGGTARQWYRVDGAGESDSDGPGDGMAVTAALPGTLGIVRALRPFKRRLPSVRPDDEVLDEEATAERAANERIWWPVTRRDTTRWLDLTLVVDAGPSMTLWRPVVAAFTTVLEQLGAFRSIRRRLLDTHDLPRLRGGAPGSMTRGAAELFAAPGRRITLVLTDGLSAGWRQGQAAAMLGRWGTVMPVAIVHLLPQRLWRAGLGLQRARLSVPKPLAANRNWRFTLPDAWLEAGPTATPAGAIPVPVVELGARWLGWLARLLTGRSDGPADGMVLLAGGREADAPTAEAGPDHSAPQEPDWPESGLDRLDHALSARQQVRNFLSAASPPAYRLATLLAAVPVSLPVARVVQAELVPESGPDHIAEVLSSGLLRPPAGNGNTWDTGTFQFPEAVRAVLLSGARRSETAHVTRVVAQHFPSQDLRRLSTALDAPDTTPEPARTADNADGRMIERVVLRALSGPYLSRARSLEDGPASPDGSADVGSGGPRDTVNEMANAVEQTSVRDEPPRPPVPADDSAAIHVVPSTESVTADMSSPTRPVLLSRDRFSEEAPAVWGNVPPRNLIFTGRAALLDQLSQRLVAGGTTAVLPAALHGMGGIGKTQMAVEYIYRHLHEYDIVWWIQATEPARIRADLTELAQHLRLPGSAEANTAVPAVREALRVGQPYRRWLLVFDAAERPDVVRPFFPTNGPGEILITSRNPDWAGIARPLGLTVFARDESIELLRRRGPEIADDEANLLAEKLGDLPLAIEQAAAWRAETGMPVAEYVRLFDEKLEEILDTSAPADYNKSVAAAWNVSFDALQEHNPAAHQLLEVCAFFAPEPISRSLFTGVRGVSVAPEFDAALRDPMRLSRAIRDINRYGLAKIDHRTDAIVLHRLVQLVLRNRMTPQHRAQMCHGAHLLLANLDPNDPTSSKQWPRYQDVLSHAYASNVLACEDSWVRQLTVNLMRFLYRWGDHQEAASLAQQAYDEWTRRLGPEDTQTLQVAEWLGFYLFELGRYEEAAELNALTLQRRRRLSGEVAEETLSMQSNVVLDLRASGDWAGAAALTGEAYEKARGIYGEDDPTTLTTAHEHAVSLRFAGDYRQARDLDDDTYRRRLEVLGYDSAATFSTLNALILDRRELGEYAWARVEMEKLVERGRTLFGAESAQFLRRLSHLAVTRRKDGDHPGALELSRSTFERFRLRYGDNQPNVLNCAIGHSIDLRHAGDLVGARELGEKTFDRFRNSFGENHPHALAATVDLAVTLRLSGDAEGARQLDERALAGLRARLGPDHPYSIVCIVNLASDRSATGDVEGAVELGTEAWNRSRHTLGEDHATTLGANANRVLDLRTLGRTQEAEKAYAEIVTRYRQLLGDTHPATIAVAGGVRADCDIDLFTF